MARAGHRVALLALALLPAPARAQADDAAAADARARPPAYLLELDGRVLRAQSAQEQRAPGSLFKLLLALEVLDAGWDADRWLRASAAAASAEPARLGLRAGEQLRAGDALAAMLVHSANDACRLLAESLPGGTRALQARLARRAADLGMRDTVLVDPCGFDAPGQHATAADLLRLGQAAWERPEVRAVAGLRAGMARTRGGRALHYATSNALLGRVPGVLGLKTGYTRQAGPCLIAVAEGDGHRAWLVMLGARDRWWRADALLRAALGHGG